MRNIIINSKEIWQCEIERNLLDNRWDNLSSILSFVQPRDGGGEKNRGVAEEKREAPGERYLDTVPLNPSIVERNRFVSARRRTIRKQPFPLPHPSTRWIATSLNFERTFVSGHFDLYNILFIRTIRSKFFVSNVCSNFHEQWQQC